MDSLRTIVVIWTIIFYGVPVIGLCSPDQVDYNSVCYQVYNMSGAVDIASNVEVTDFTFFRYEVSRFRYNPAFVSFFIDTLPGDNLVLTALQICNEDQPTPGCSWSGLNAGNVTLRSDQDTVYNPTSSNPNSTVPSCGCEILNDNGTNPVWYIRIENLSATTQNITVDLEMTSEDLCSEHGNFTAGSNMNPAVANRSYCVCDEGYAGSQCQFSIANISTDSSMIVNTSPYEVAYLKFEHDNAGFNDIVFNATVLSGNCSGVKSRVSYSCGECIPGYPYSFDATFSETFRQTGFNYSQYHSSEVGAFSVSVFDEIRDQCGCNVNNTLEEWYWAIDASAVNGSCSFEASVSVNPTCGSSNEPVCGGVGVCSANMCECPSNRQGLKCTSGIEKPKEQYNGVFYAKRIKPRANVVLQTYVVLSPLTNRNVRITLQPFSGDVDGYLGAIEDEGTPNPTVPTNGTLDQNGTLIFLASFSQPPQYDLVMNPLYYPSLEVGLDINATKYDFAGTLKADGDVSVVIPIDSHTPEKLYITVLSLGTYSAIDSKPLEEPDIEFVMYVSLEDNIATLIDVILMIVFIAIVLFFCIAWKTCPSIFHSTMKKIIPELYYIEYQKKEQEQVERAKVSSEVAKTAAYALAGTLYGLWLLLKMIPYPEDQTLDNIPQETTVEAAIDRMDNWMTQAPQLPVIKLDVMPFNIPPRMLLQMIKAKIPDVSATVNIAEGLSPAGFLDVISSSVPDADVTLNLTSVPGLVAALSTQFPDVTVIKEIGIELTAVSSANIPLVPLTDDMDVPSILSGFKNSLSQIPNMTRDISLFLKIDKLLSLPDIHNLTLQDLGLNVTPVQIPINLDNVQYPIVKVHKFKHDVSLSIEVEAEVPRMDMLEIMMRFSMGFVSICLQNLAFIVIEFMILMFNVAIIHSAFANYPTFQAGMPKIEEVQQAFSNIAGDFGNFVYVISGFFKYLDFFFLLNSWNCGGTLTMITPFIFLLGAILTWIILEKDLLLYLAIKLKAHKVNPKSKVAAAVNSVWMGISRVMVKVTILTLQAVILCLTQAVTTTTTQRTCNDVDLVANTFGKVIVAFFYVFFYIMFFFIFTGAPDWERYKGMGFLPSIGLVFVDGLYRFSLLTMGVWNDATVRAFNIIGRAQRYDEDLSHSPMDSAMLRLGMSAPPAVTNLLKQSETNKQMKQALHEQIMHLIAISRTVVWIPIPLCMVVAKFSEALNTAIVFIKVNEEPIQLKRVLPLRIFIWIFHVVQMPLLLTVVFTASKAVTIALAATLIPLASLRTVVGVLKLVVELFGSFKDVRIAASVMEMTDLA